MTIKSPILILGLFSVIFAIGAERIYCSTTTSPDLRGTWSGTFISRNADISPFTITVKINPDLGGHLVGDASVVSDCLSNHRLQVTVTGSHVLMNGSDDEHDTVSFKGTVDGSGTVLTLNYIINGSPSGRCEIDDGSGTMGRR